MSDLSNIGHAILIIGAIYLHLIYGLDIAVTIGLCLFALITWSYAGFVKERREEFRARIELFRAKAQYYIAKRGER